jgi:hypothetical protein
MELTIEEKRSLAAVRDAGFKFGKCCAGDVLANGTATPAIAIYMENGADLLDHALTCGILPNLDERIFRSIFRAGFDQGFSAEKMARRQ